MNNPSTILVTGACSFVGRHLVGKLLEDSGIRVLACCRNKRPLFGLHRRLTTVSADLLQTGSYDAIFRKYRPRHVIHLAAVARLRQGEEDPELAVRTNLLGSCRLIDRAVESGALSFVFVSSNMARKPQSVVGATKFLTEAYMQKKKAENTRLVSLRLPNVPGSPGSVTLIFQKQIENNRPVTVTHPEMSRVFVSRDEAAQFIRSLTEHGKNRQVFVVSKAAKKISQLAEEMIRDSGKKLAVKYIGMQVGEKLAEEPYPVTELSDTKLEGLSLYSSKEPLSDEIQHALSILEERLGRHSNTAKEIRKLFNKLA